MFSKATQHWIPVGPPGRAGFPRKNTQNTQINLNKTSSAKLRSDSNQSSKPCIMLQYPSRKACYILKGYTTLNSLKALRACWVHTQNHDLSRGVCIEFYLIFVVLCSERLHNIFLVCLDACHICQKRHIKGIVENDKSKWFDVWQHTISKMDLVRMIWRLTAAYLK